MKNKNKILSILSHLEQFAFYSLPDFDDEQRSTFFLFEDQEWELISQAPLYLHNPVETERKFQDEVMKLKHPFMRDDPATIC